VESGERQTDRGNYSRRIEREQVCKQDCWKCLAVARSLERPVIGIVCVSRIKRLRFDCGKAHELIAKICAGGARSGERKYEDLFGRWRRHILDEWA